MTDIKICQFCEEFTADDKDMLQLHYVSCKSLEYDENQSTSTVAEEQTEGYHHCQSDAEEELLPTEDADVINMMIGTGADEMEENEGLRVIRLAQKMVKENLVFRLPIKANISLNDANESPIDGNVSNDDANVFCVPIDANRSPVCVNSNRSQTQSECNSDGEKTSLDSTIGIPSQKPENIECESEEREKMIDHTGIPSPPKTPRNDETKRSRNPSRVVREQRLVDEAKDHGKGNKEKGKRKKDCKLTKLNCICQQPYEGEFMFECVKCNEWYHPACVDYKCDRCYDEIKCKYSVFRHEIEDMVNVVSMMEEKIGNLEEKIEKKDTIIQGVEEEKKKSEEKWRIKMNNGKIKEKEEELKSVHQELKKSQNSLEIINKRCSLLNKENAEFKQEVKTLLEHQSVLRKISGSNEANVISLQKENQQLAKEMAAHIEINSKLINQFEEDGNVSTTTTGGKNDVKEKLREKTKEIGSLKTRISTLETIIRENEGKVQVVNTKLSAYKVELKREKHLNNLLSKFDPDVIESKDEDNVVVKDITPCLTPNKTSDKRDTRDKSDNEINNTELVSPSSNDGTKYVRNKREKAENEDKNENNKKLEK